MLSWVCLHIQFVLGLGAFRLFLEWVSVTFLFFFFSIFLLLKNTKPQHGLTSEKEPEVFLQPIISSPALLAGPPRWHAVPQSILRARHLLEFITAAPASLITWRTKDRVSSLNLNISWIMSIAGMLDGRLRIQNDFSHIREMLWKWLKFS